MTRYFHCDVNSYFDIQPSPTSFLSDYNEQSPIDNLLWQSIMHKKEIFTVLSHWNFEVVTTTKP